MSTRTNLRFVAAELNSMSSSSLGEWLRVGVESIVLEGAYPPDAFSPGKYMIGINEDNWKEDLVAIYGEMLPSRRRMMNVGLREAIDLLPPGLAINQPSANAGRNSESLAITYLGLSRAFRSGEVLSTIDGLIRTKFPRSASIYASALYTWRILASYDSVTDWRDVFLPSDDRRREPRFQLPFSAPIVLGMCAAQPRRTAEFLSWRPFQEHVAELIQNIEDAASVDDLRGLVAACETLGADIRGAKPPVLRQVAIMQSQLTGELGQVGRSFQQRHEQALARPRSLRTLTRPATGPTAITTVLHGAGSDLKFAS